VEELELIGVSVSQLTERIKQRLEEDILLQDVLVRGELSNFKRHSSGHLYFTMKDHDSSLRCVMFRSSAQKLPFDPADGEEILAQGRIGIYQRGGQYQLYVYELVPLGQGALALAFEQLKGKLAGEGLFDQARKRALPLFPKRIGIVSSPTGAAIRDFISVARRRWPLANLVLAPALVQGENAAPSIVEALELLCDEGDVELIVVTRGGGSLEDLWPFNEERVARAIFACPLPVVSAVGHEIDFTIADFVADLRAPTPSSAAELALPDLVALQGQLRDYYTRLGWGLRSQVRFTKKRLAVLAQSRIFRHKEELLAQRQLEVDELARSLEQTVGERIKEKDQKLRLLAQSLQQLSPLATLSRGYSICRRGRNVVRDAEQLTPGDKLEVIFARGRVGCTVGEIDLDSASRLD